MPPPSDVQRQQQQCSSPNVAACSASRGAPSYAEEETDAVLVASCQASPDRGEHRAANARGSLVQHVPVPAPSATTQSALGCRCCAAEEMLGTSSGDATAAALGPAIWASAAAATATAAAVPSMPGSAAQRQVASPLPLLSAALQLLTTPAGPAPAAAAEAAHEASQLGLPAGLVPTRLAFDQAASATASPALPVAAGERPSTASSRAQALQRLKQRLTQRRNRSDRLGSC